MYLNENIIALVTPYYNEKVDYLSIEKYFNFIGEHTPYTAVLFLGSTGDQHAISLEDKIKMYRFVNKMKTNLKIIYGVSSVNTRNVFQIIDELNKMNVQDLMLGVPPYILPNQEEILHYVKSISMHTKADILLYNNYLRTGVNIDIPTINLILESCPNVIGVKEAGINQNISDIHTKYIYTGSDLQMVKGDFYSCTSVAGNIMPYTASYFSKRIISNDYDEIKKQYVNILKQLLDLGLGKAIKHHLKKKEIIVSEETMLPILPLNSEEVVKMDNLENEINLLEIKVNYQLA